MDCSECENPINPDEKQSENCGESVVQEEPAKRISKAKYWLLGAASVLFAACILVAVFFAEISAWVERLALSPEALMMKAVASAAQDLGVGSAESDSSAEKPNKYTVGIYVDGVLEAFLTNGEENWISALSVQFASVNNEDLQRTQMSVLVKEESIFTLDVIRGTEKVWIGVPELNDRYLEYAPEDLEDEFLDGMKQKLPSTKELSTLVRTYGTILFESIHQVEEDDATLQVSGISQDALKMTATIREEDSRAALAEIAQRLKQDELAQRLLNHWAGDGEDFSAILVNYLESLSKTTKGDLQLIAYLDDYNQLIGFEICDPDEGSVFRWEKAISDEQFGTLIAFGRVVLSGSGTMADGKKTGEFKLKVEDTEVLTYQLKDFSLTDNGFTGSVFFPIPREITEMLGIAFANTEIGIELVQNNVNGEAVLFINLVAGNKPQAGLTVKTEKTDLSAQAPTNVVPAKKEEDIEVWLQGFNWSIIPEKLMNAGIPIDAIGHLLP